MSRAYLPTDFVKRKKTGRIFLSKKPRYTNLIVWWFWNDIEEYQYLFCKWVFWCCSCNTLIFSLKEKTLLLIWFGRNFLSPCILVHDKNKLLIIRIINLIEIERIEKLFALVIVPLPRHIWAEIIAQIHQTNPDLEAWKQS